MSLVLVQLGRRAKDLESKANWLEFRMSIWSIDNRRIYPF